MRARSGACLARGSRAWPRHGPAGRGRCRAGARRSQGGALRSGACRGGRTGTLSQARRASDYWAGSEPGSRGLVRARSGTRLARGSRAWPRHGPAGRGRCRAGARRSQGWLFDPALAGAAVRERCRRLVEPATTGLGRNRVVGASMRARSGTRLARGSRAWPRHGPAGRGRCRAGARRSRGGARRSGAWRGSRAGTLSQARRACDYWAGSEPGSRGLDEGAIRGLPGEGEPCMAPALPGSRCGRDARVPRGGAVADAP
jgi:hypothetical protein